MSGKIGTDWTTVSTPLTPGLSSLNCIQSSDTSSVYPNLRTSRTIGLGPEEAHPDHRSARKFVMGRGVKSSGVCGPTGRWSPSCRMSRHQSYFEPTQRSSTYPPGHYLGFTDGRHSSTRGVTRSGNDQGPPEVG